MSDAESLQQRIDRVTAEPIEVVEYDEAWPEAFKEEKRRLRSILPKGLVGRIEHFGSTAVPGLAAKPVIDMLVEVSSLEEVRERVVPILEAQGYEYFWRPTFGDDGEPHYAWFIKRDPDTGVRTHHIHMVEADFAPHWDRLLFRDYLRKHPDVAEEYGRLKLMLAAEHPGDRVAYTRAKGEFIDAVTEGARKAALPTPTRFFVTTFIASWIIWIPLALVRLGLIETAIPPESLGALALPGVLMPGICGLILTARSGGREARRRLTRRALQWRVGTAPWAFVLLAQPLLLMATAIAYNATGLPAGVRFAEGLAPGTLAVSAVFLLLASTGEEIGWRGVALPGLQLRHNPPRSSVVLGVVAATWHLPYWVLLGTLEQYGSAYFLVNYLFVVALTFQLTWLFNRSRGSVLIAIAFHVVFNIINVAVLPVTGNSRSFLMLTLLEWVLAIVLLRQPGMLPRAGEEAMVR